MDWREDGLHCFRYAGGVRERFVRLGGITVMIWSSLQIISTVVHEYAGGQLRRFGPASSGLVADRTHMGSKLRGSVRPCGGLGMQMTNT